MIIERKGSGGWSEWRGWEGRMVDGGGKRQERDGRDGERRGEERGRGEGGLEMEEGGMGSPIECIE
jgi:hypothetical protein